jgi:hypothetical protein
VVNAQHAHVGAATTAALGDLAERLVVDAQEADGSSGATGRNRLKEKPLPPPVCWISAATRSVLKMPSLALPMSSSIGSTKQAASWPSGVPAPVKVGLLGKKRRSESRS